MTVEVDLLEYHRGPNIFDVVIRLARCIYYTVFVTFQPLPGACSVTIVTGVVFGC